MEDQNGLPTKGTKRRERRRRRGGPRNTRNTRKGEKGWPQKTRRDANGEQVRRSLPRISRMGAEVGTTETPRPRSREANLPGKRRRERFNCAHGGVKNRFTVKNMERMERTDLWYIPKSELHGFHVLQGKSQDGLTWVRTPQRRSHRCPRADRAVWRGAPNWFVVPVSDLPLGYCGFLRLFGANSGGQWLRQWGGPRNTRNTRNWPRVGHKKREETQKKERERRSCPRTSWMDAVSGLLPRKTRTTRKVGGGELVWVLTPRKGVAHERHERARKAEAEGVPTEYTEDTDGADRETECFTALPSQATASHDANGHGGG